MKKVLPFILAAAVFAPDLFAITPVELPEKIVKRADEIVGQLFHGKAEDYYRSFDPELQKQTTPAEAAEFTAQIAQVIASSESVQYSHGNFYPEENTWALVYLAKGKNKIIYELNLGLREEDGKIFIRAFHLKDKAFPPFNLTNGTFLHYLMFVLFFFCIAAMLTALIYFLLQKDLKFNWLYALSSFLGFPVGIALNWATNQFTLKFGINVPAVGLSALKSAPDEWTVAVFMPFGVLLMLRSLFKKKTQQS